MPEIMAARRELWHDPHAARVVGEWLETLGAIEQFEYLRNLPDEAFRNLMMHGLSPEATAEQTICDYCHDRLQRLGYVPPAL